MSSLSSKGVYVWRDLTENSVIESTNKMGKRKDTSTEEEVSIDASGNSPHKKHKKHKHKKHKRQKREREPDQDVDSGDGNEQPQQTTNKQQQPLKLKIKIGGKNVNQEKKVWPPSDSTVAKVIPESASDDDLHIEVGEDGPIAAPASAPSVDSDISDEDAWLEALESGKLDEYDELKRMKDPALMTARQRALLESKTQRDGQLPELQMLPLGYKEKEMTEEMIQKRALRAKKRRQQAHEKREKDKKLTIDRLLKKQDTKTKSSRMKTSKKTQVPKITYLNNLSTISISFPSGVDFPLPAQGPKVSPSNKLPCGVDGCSNPKKYSCSKTGIPLCSLQCYKKNLINHNLIMCS